MITKENITFLIAILGFLLSLWNFAFVLLSQRRKIDIRGLSSHLNTSGTELIVLVQFENRSRVPIAITRIQLLGKGEPVDCLSVPKLIFEVTRRSGNVITSKQDTYSLSIPIEIGPLGAASGFVVFRGDQETFQRGATETTVIISTNRGRPFQRTLELPPDQLVDTSFR